MGSPLDPASATVSRHKNMYYYSSYNFPKSTQNNVK